MVQDRGTEIAQIKILLEKIMFDINFKLLPGYPDNISEINQNPR